MNAAFRLIVAAAFVLLSGLGATAEVVFPPGSRIGLVPPPGMAPSARTVGFEDPARGAVVAITELAAQSYARMTQEFSADAMQRAGMEVLAREDFDLPGGPALITTGRQGTGAAAIRKWALLALVGDLTAVVIVSVPEAARDAYPDAAIRAALLSVEVRGRLPDAEMLSVLPYRLADLAGFRVLRATPQGTVTMTLGPNDTPLPAEQPYFSVMLRPAEMPQTAAQDAFARRMLAEFSPRGADRIVSSEPLRITGAPGHQIIAESRDDRTGDELVLVQWLRFGAGVTVQMFGIAKKSEWDGALARMRTVRDGLGGK